MSDRVLNDRERTVLLPLIKTKLKEKSVEKSNKQIEDALNAYMDAAEHAPEDYANKPDENIVDEVISNYLSNGGRRRSNKRPTARRSSKARKVRKSRKVRKARKSRTTRRK
jgi:hypothetical protein